MKKILITLIITFCCNTVFCQSGYLQRLGHVATIIFPDTPKMRPTKRGELYSLLNNKNFYVAQVSNINKNIKDLLTTNLDSEVYAGVIRGSLKSTGGKLVYKKNINVKGLTGVEFCYAARLNSLNYYRYHQTFYFNNKLVLYGFWSADSLQREGQAKAFFNTFKLTLKDADIIQGNSKDLAYKTGKLIGILLIIVFIVLMGLGAVFILRKIIYK